jgi:drug/metabolite transporter (DMT)-like permease
MAIPGCLMSFGAYSMVVWAMSQAPIPLVSALRETSIIIAALIGAYYFKEPSGWRRIFASILIFASVALLGFDQD